MKTTSEKVKAILWKCLVINFFMLILLSIGVLLSDQIYKIHSNWFSGSKEEFANFLYYVIAFYKTAWIFFNVVPYLAIRWVDKKNSD